MDKKLMILESAIKVLAKTPTAPVGDIAKAAGVTRVTVNRHFANRDNLVKEALSHAQAKFAAAVDDVERAGGPGAKTKLAGFIERLIPLHWECVFLMRFMAWQSCGEDLVEFAQQQAIVDGWIKCAQAEGTVRQDFSPDWIVTVLSYVALAIGDIKELGAIAPRDAAKVAIDIFFNGCGDKR